MLNPASLPHLVEYMVLVLDVREAMKIGGGKMKNVTAEVIVRRNQYETESERRGPRTSNIALDDGRGSDIE